MRIATAYQTQNRCYQKAKPARHVGILVHATGAVNRELRRYVDAPELVGKNQYGNHWNSAGANKCMHAFIGLDAACLVCVMETLPYEYACWGCGSGRNGSYNNDPTAHIQFEICQGSNTDETYYQSAMAAAEEYCAYLCQKFGWSADDIVSHREAAALGYASNHGDPESWMQHFGDDMGQFRARVAARLKGENAPPAAGAPSASPTLRAGARGESVRAAQALLLSLGYALPAFGADGVFGAETRAALTRFQAGHDLPVNGVCDADTWRALRDAARDGMCVIVPGLNEEEAEYLMTCYPGARVAEAVAAQ